MFFKLFINKCENDDFVGNKNVFVANYVLNSKLYFFIGFYL